MANRREFLLKTTALGAFSLNTLADHSSTQVKGKLKIFCIGGHPDDPESGCGGTLAKFSKAGHDVNILYLTKGEAGIEGKTHAQAASIRTREVEQACTILNAKPFFLGQIDGDTVFNSEWIQKMTDFLDGHQPDLVFSQWPVDTHKDHQVAALLTLQAWMRTKKKFQLYLYEVCLGNQTMAFHPTDYIDITEEQALKRKALFCHVSQNPEEIYSCGHEIMEKFRGAEAGFKAAEAFVKINGLGTTGSII
jgi:LmbE family N-acetylglucosaminyl deacetylase